MASTKDYPDFVLEQVSKPNQTDLYEKLAVAEQQIADGAQGEDFATIALQMRENKLARN